MSTPDTSPLGDLQQFAVAGLFGQRDVEFVSADEGPTLLFGQNGTGKSTILRLINDVANGRWLSVIDTPFSELRLGFSSGSMLIVARRNDELTLVLDSDVWVADRDLIRRARRRQAMRERRSVETGRTVRYSQSELFRDPNVPEFPYWVASITSRFPVLLIEDQRLVIAAQNTRGESGPGVHSAVGRLPALLRSEIQFAFSVYGSRSQALDRRFPIKLVEAVDQQDAHRESADAVQELRLLLDRVRVEREALERVGLLSDDEDPVNFDRSRLEEARLRPVIRVFAENTLEKFSVLNDFRVRLETFSSFLNQHYKGKCVVTNREEGFAIVLDDDVILPPWKLSSGEQQILALAYRILFASEPGTLILIDEPELSLHVLWQSTLIDDLAAMGAARGVSFILATHSPTVIGDRTELMRSLDSYARPPSSLADDEWDDDDAVFSLEGDESESFDDDDFMELADESGDPEA